MAFGETDKRMTSRIRAPWRGDQFAQCFVAAHEHLRHARGHARRRARFGRVAEVLLNDLVAPDDVAADGGVALRGEINTVYRMSGE